MFSTLFYTNFHRTLAFFTRTFHRITFMTTAFLVLFIIIESLHILPQFLVERMLRHRVFIAEDDELHAGSRHCHVHAAEVFQESYLSFIIGTNQGDENHVSFLPLEGKRRDPHLPGTFQR